MEGKAALFKRFAGIGAWPICLATQDTEEIIRTVEVIAPCSAASTSRTLPRPGASRSSGGCDLPTSPSSTTISTAPRSSCSRRSRARCVVGKQLEDVRIVLSGAGAAGTAILGLLLAAGAHDVVVGDVHGIVHRDRGDDHASLQQIAERTNPRGLRGALVSALDGADVFIGVSVAGVVSEADVASMAPGAIVFALANPDPEVDPVVARRHAAVVATGRSDFPNQINNVLAFPGCSAGCSARRAARCPAGVAGRRHRLADVVGPGALTANYIVPSVFHPDLATTVAAAVRESVESAEPERRRWDQAASTSRAARSRAHRAFDQPVHLGGALGTGPVDAAGRLRSAAP
jgi:malate dehydrogenase (oxaloacetate-decarboxylating)